MTSWERKESKRQWAIRNPDKVRYANRNYRRAFSHRTNAQAAARMRRYRARRKRDITVPSKS